MRNIWITIKFEGNATEEVRTEDDTVKRFPWLSDVLHCMDVVTLKKTDGTLLILSALSEDITHMVVKRECRDDDHVSYTVHPITESLVNNDEECWNRECWGSEEKCIEWASDLNECEDDDLDYTRQ